jgi:hypothetical protein
LALAWATAHGLHSAPAQPSSGDDFEAHVAPQGLVFAAQTGGGALGKVGAEEVTEGAGGAVGAVVEQAATSAVRSASEGAANRATRDCERIPDLMGRVCS